MNQHYCFTTDKDAGNYSYMQRIHIPIANKCGLGCIYCDYLNSQNIGGELGTPGSCTKLIQGKEQMIEYLASRISSDTEMIGISGPGDPFMSLEQLKIFWEIYREKYSHLKLCICSSGYNFHNAYRELDLKLIDYITFTINSLSVQTCKKVYRSLGNDSNSERLVKDQYDAIEYFAGTTKLKVNTVFLPGINDEQIVDMALNLYKRGVQVFNLLKCEASESYLKKYNIVLQKLKRQHALPMLDKCLQCTSDSCSRL